MAYEASDEEVVDEHIRHVVENEGSNTQDLLKKIVDDADKKQISTWLAIEIENRYFRPSKGVTKAMLRGVYKKSYLLIQFVQACHNHSLLMLKSCSLAKHLLAHALNHPKALL